MIIMPIIVVASFYIMSIVIGPQACSQGAVQRDGAKESCRGKVQRESGKGWCRGKVQRGAGGKVQREGAMPLGCGICTGCTV
jgi:hypothetical protein